MTSLNSLRSCSHFADRYCYGTLLLYNDRHNMLNIAERTLQMLLERYRTWETKRQLYQKQTQSKITKLKKEVDQTFSWTNLNILSFNFVAAPRKSLRFTRFIRSYVNRPAVVLSNHCQSYTALLFCLMCSLQSCHIPFFCSCLFPMIVHLRCWANLLPGFCDLQGGQERNKSEIVINISNLTVGVIIPSAAKQRYFLISIQYRRKVWNVCPLYNINIMIFPLHI